MYYVSFRGTSNGFYVRANSSHDAKWIVAVREGLNSIGYLTAKKVDNHYESMAIN